MNMRFRLKKDGALFLTAVLFECIFSAFLMLQHRVPAGHDSFQYFTLQYYFLNNYVNCEEIPQWIPFMTHGTIATVWYSIQAGILQNVLFLSGKLLAGVNFIYIFIVGVFIDELLLITGVWLLGKRFFRSPLTIFFVTVTVMGSCVWFTQVWWNMHIYYAIPLILYFIHRFIDSGKWIYCFMAGNLLALQILGNLQYFIPVCSLVIFLYFFYYSIFNFGIVRNRIKAIKWRWNGVISLFLVACSFFIVYTMLRWGIEDIRSYNFGRCIDYATNLKTFLNYGGNLNLIKWLELVLGVSSCKDYTLYIGLLSVFFIIIWLFYGLERKNLHFSFLLLTLLLFSMGTLVSAFFYYLWPFMKFYRHLCLVSPIIKLFLCFVAGFGFELLANPESRMRIFIRPRASQIRILLIFSALMLVLAIILFYGAVNRSFFVNLMFDMVESGGAHLDKAGNVMSYTDGLPVMGDILREAVLKPHLISAAFYAMAVSFFVMILPYLSRKNSRVSVLSIALFFQIYDIYSYKTFQKDAGTIMLDNSAYKAMYFESMPYTKKRDVLSRGDSPRALVLFESAEAPSFRPAFYWTTDAFLFRDRLGSWLRTDQWMSPLDRFMRAYWAQPINDTSIRPAGLFYYEKLEFPSNHPAALKIAGSTEDKIQFFSDGYIVDSDDSIAAKITDVNYGGDILFLSGFEKGQEKGYNNRMSVFDRPLSSNTRLRVPYDIIRFDSNHMEIKVDIQDRDNAWLFYSDVWNPLWRAVINGEPAQVFRADLAYKAVKLNRGLNMVHFIFYSNTLAFLQFLLGVNSLLWLGVIIWLSVRIFTGG